MLVENLAVVPETDGLVSMSEVTRVAAAAQKQVVRDMEPIWEIRCTVDAFAVLDDVPIGYWPVILSADVKDAAGIHLDRDGQPFALVEAGSSHPNWSLTASHEILEMLVDPFGKRLVAGAPPPQAINDGAVGGLTRVQYLVEVCDPSEDEAYAYTVNDVLVSDFYTPNYFDPVKATGVRYSFRNEITGPREVLPGGYVSFGDPETNHWFQVTWFDGGQQASVVDLGVLAVGSGSLRAEIDRLTSKRRIKAQTRLTAARAAAAPPPQRAGLLTASGAGTRTIGPTSAKARQWRDAIKTFRK